MAPGDSLPVRLPWQSAGRNHCFGCGRDNPAGLGLELTEQGEYLVSDFTPTRLHESYPGIVHGGIAAAVLDELMGNLIVHREKKVCFTTGLRMTYAGVLRVGDAYRAIAWMPERPTVARQPFKVHGEIRDDTGTPLVIARGWFQWISTEWYRLHLAPGTPLEPELAPFLGHED